MKMTNNYFPQIAEGIPAGVDNGILLSPKQWIGMGKHAHFIDWTETAVKKIITGEDTVELSDAKIQLETSNMVVSQQ